LDAVISCSQFVADYFVDQLPSLAGRSLVVHNGYAPKLFNPGPDVRPDRRDTLRLLYVGSVAPEKGVHVLVDAFRVLAPRFRQLELDIVGPVGWSVPSQMPLVPPDEVRSLRALRGGYGDELVRRAGQFAGRVHLVGPLRGDDLVSAYRRASVYVQPTVYTEGFGMPVLEAMACGTPAVVSNSGGMPELVDPGVTGFVVPPGDHAALANALGHLLDDAELRAQMGAASHQRAATRYAWGAIGDELDDALHKIQQMERNDRRRHDDLATGSIP
jgi:glycosyltransferase involved in cell wall biosynthesis